MKIFFAFRVYRTVSCLPVECFQNCWNILSDSFLFAACCTVRIYLLKADNRYNNLNLKPHST